jgi:diamine N-acetyltransferase
MGRGAPVGTAGLMAIDWRLSRATFGISIGERRGTGLGTEATRLTLDWAFNMLGRHNVMLTVLPTNAAAIRAYEKAGFKRIGLRRDALSVVGERGDELLMDAVAGEFDSPVLAARRAS